MTKAENRSNPLKIVMKKVKDLKPYLKNARTHDKAQIDLIALSIKKFGFNNPCLLDGENGMIAGHGRLAGAVKLGMAEVPCIELSHLSGAAKKAYILADNQLALRGGWDEKLLKEELADLEAEGVDMKLLGFADAELKALMAPARGSTEQEDDVPELPAVAVSRLGDQWLLGAHTVRCGDSTSAKDVSALLGSAKPELLFTSPPYSDLRTYNGVGELAPEHLCQFISVASNDCRYQVINLGLKRKDHEIIPYWDVYIDTAKKSGYKFLSWGVWSRPSAGSVGNQSAFLPVMHEWMFVFGKEFKHINRCEDRVKPHDGKTHRTNRQKDGTMKNSTVGVCGKLKELGSVVTLSQEMNNDLRKLHPALFPVELPRKYILAITNKNEAIYDPFLGSGTTLIAAESEERQCLGMELDPLYVDTIVKRWQNFTGKDAVLEGTKHTFAEVANGRKS